MDLPYLDLCLLFCWYNSEWNQGGGGTWQNQAEGTGNCRQHCCKYLPTVLIPPRGPINPNLHTNHPTSLPVSLPAHCWLTFSSCGWTSCWQAHTWSPAIRIGGSFADIVTASAVLMERALCWQNARSSMEGAHRIGLLIKASCVREREVALFVLLENTEVVLLFFRMSHPHSGAHSSHVRTLVCLYNSCRCVRS